MRCRAPCCGCVADDRFAAAVGFVPARGARRPRARRVRAARWRACVAGRRRLPIRPCGGLRAPAAARPRTRGKRAGRGVARPARDRTIAPARREACAVAATARTAQGLPRMSALVADAPSPSVLRAMREADLPAVMAIEQRAYVFPWTQGVFRDCLLAHHPSWVLIEDGHIVGYAVLSVAVDEAHVLNLCTAPEAQG